MKHLTLFQLTETIADTVADIIDADLDGEDTTDLHDSLAALYKTRSAKYEGYVHVIKNTENAAEACKAEAAAFTARAKALENLSRYLKTTLRDDLHQHGEKSVAAGNFRIARQKGQPRVVVRIDASELPADYQRVRVEADKTALKTALKAGETVDGVELETTEHIRIRVK